MKTLKIYDPAMCCPTGVCGTSVDTKLVQLSNFLKTKSTISDYEKLRYGGFSNSTKLSYHAPLYIGKNNKFRKSN